ncbi:MAG: hypothetical protein OXR66_01845 [Candidatus Woesearchaeota archaeon]|nr:hypothetical protein [Candidatus Woesearchaeota archaeon]
MVRGQAALEFISNYGWGLIVIIAAFGALAYYGVFDLQEFVPEKCEMGVGFHCFDVIVGEESVSLRLQNGMNKDISVTGFEVELHGGTCTYTGPPVFIPAGSDANISTDERCLLLTKEGNKKITPEITYMFSDGQYPKKQEGEIVAH